MQKRQQKKNLLQGQLFWSVGVFWVISEGAETERNSHNTKNKSQTKKFTSKLKKSMLIYEKNFVSTKNREMQLIRKAVRSERGKTLNEITFFITGFICIQNTNFL